jgi:pantoate--beta-alanine ligase
MQVLTTIAVMRAALRAVRAQSPGPLGLVPTMGALHAGHLSLVERARASCGVVAATLFVNPTQFAPGEDFERYPRPFERDRELFEAAGVELLFAPTAEEMYPRGSTTFVDVGELGTKLDGASRPGHFRGVATVVSKLFHIVQPDLAFFGQKDAVQVAVLRRMVQDLNFPVELVACPIVRDADGLALSSRNAYLSAAERTQALAIPRALQAIRTGLDAGVTTPQQVLQTGLRVLSAESGVGLEYLAAVDPASLAPVTEIVRGTLIALAARVGQTRLIDNLLA